MHSVRHISSAAEALYKVVVHSIERPRPSICSVSRPLQYPCSNFQSYFPRSTQRRNYVQPQRPPVNDEIEAREIHIVDDSGTFHPVTPLKDALRSFDHKTYQLVQVAPPEADRAPVCRIISKARFRESLRKQSKAKTKAPSSSSKQLELNWAIDPNDLGHRLDKMQQFLEQGRRVEIILASKKKGKGRRASPEEAEAVLKQIKERAMAVEGTKELKSMEGKILGLVTLYFEGPSKK
ncbi:MAG: hypothetical protein M1819_000333 [Sarea resinae]|nr:MAG: hypothetical protein M1819_000333 [Sarea resinae]